MLKESVATTPIVTKESVVTTPSDSLEVVTTDSLVTIGVVDTDSLGVVTTDSLVTIEASSEAVSTTPSASEDSVGSTSIVTKSISDLRPTLVSSSRINFSTLLIGFFVAAVVFNTQMVKESLSGLLEQALAKLTQLLLRFDASLKDKLKEEVAFDGNYKRDKNKKALVIGKVDAQVDISQKLNKGVVADKIVRKVDTNKQMNIKSSSVKSTIITKLPSITPISSKGINGKTTSTSKTSTPTTRNKLLLSNVLDLVPYLIVFTLLVLPGLKLLEPSSIALTETIKTQFIPAPLSSKDNLNPPTAVLKDTTKAGSKEASTNSPGDISIIPDSQASIRTLPSDVSIDNGDDNLFLL